MEKDNYKVGIDIGGTKTEGVLLDRDNNVIRIERIPTNKLKGYNFIVKNVVGLIKLLTRELFSDYEVGIGSPGAEHPNTFRIQNSNIEALNGRQLRLDLEKHLGKKVKLENDANCFAIAESIIGAGKEYSTGFYIVLGTGCGGAYISDGMLVKGANNLAGEWGHTSIDYKGAQCYCGRKGCIENYISGTAIESYWFEKVRKKLTILQIYNKFLAGCSQAKEVFEFFLDAFAAAIANVIRSFDPEVIVIGGGLSNLPLIFDEGINRARELLRYTSPAFPIIKKYQISDSSGSIGAALW